MFHVKICIYSDWVTLHVSVWVEISAIRLLTVRVLSRSTWACELKFQSVATWQLLLPSRSTWACELKLKMCECISNNLCHAPRERVSWNLKICQYGLMHSVTLHVSVWVEIPDTIDEQVLNLVTLHVSVWVEIFYIEFLFVRQSSRSTWACELKLTRTRKLRCL